MNCFSNAILTCIAGLKLTIRHLTRSIWADIHLRELVCSSSFVLARSITSLSRLEEDRPVDIELVTAMYNGRVNNFIIHFRTVKYRR
jgi:hypothetical protein